MMNKNNETISKTVFEQDIYSESGFLKHPAEHLIFLHEFHTSEFMKVKTIELDNKYSLLNTFPT